MAHREISVVVPTWNSASTLDWTLLSLRSQQDCRVQVIVADSGSLDGTLEICQRWNVQSMYVPPGNMYRAINAAMRLLDTEWLTYLNSDDVVYSDAYVRLIEHGERLGADVVYGHTDYVDTHGRFSYGYSAASVYLLRFLFQEGIMGFAQPAAIFRKAVYHALSGFSEEYRLISDSEFYARAIRARKVFARLPWPSVAAFRIHTGQIGAAHNEVAKEEDRLLRSAEYSRNSSSLAPLVLWRMSNVSNYVIKVLRSLYIRRGMCV